MSSEEERKEVFTWFGAASYYAQCVEVELWIARLVLVRENQPWPEEQEWQRLESEPLTMGRLLRLVDSEIGLETGDLEALQDCLKKRNWLFHDYWLQRSHLLASSEGCHQAVHELRELCDVFKRCDEVARRVSARVRSRVGISENLIQKLQDEYVQRLELGQSHEVILREQQERLKQLSARISATKE